MVLLLYYLFIVLMKYLNTIIIIIILIVTLNGFHKNNTVTIAKIPLSWSTSEIEQGISLLL